MQIAQQWSAAEFSSAASCESVLLIASLPADQSFPAIKTFFMEVKRLIRQNASANELLFNCDQLCLHLVNRAITFEIRFNQQFVHWFKMLFLINALF